MTPEQLSENGQEIRRLLGEGLSANGLAAALDCIYQKLKQDMAAVRAWLETRNMKGGEA